MLIPLPSPDVWTDGACTQCSDCAGSLLNSGNGSQFPHSTDPGPSVLAFENVLA